jgi:hypothetical protein
VAEQPDSLRAADVDREFVAEKLRGALNEGRLTLSEYDDRLRDAYAARTYGELKGLLADLPEVAPAERGQLAPRADAGALGLDADGAVVIPRGHTRRWIAGRWSGWLSTSLIVIAIWFATSIGSGHLDNFWPIWVIVPWGAILLAGTISGAISGEPRRQAEREARKRVEREARKRDEREARRLERGERHDS